jgi:hypothetical protein
MPIQIKQPSSLAEVERDILSLEEQYGMSSAEFTARHDMEGVVSEFDAIEWSFLLMQKRAIAEDRPAPSAFFRNHRVTSVDMPDHVDLYDLAA